MSARVILKASGYVSGSWNDESGQGNNATLGSGIALKNSAGNGLVFDGSTAWTLPNLSVGNAWTAAAWVKSKGNIGTNPSILTQVGGDTGLTLSLFDNGYQGGFYNSISGWQLGSPISLEYAKWTNVQVTWDGSAITTYINGNLIVSVPIATTSVSNGQDFRIGQRWDVEDFFVGEIGEIRVYDYALTQEQVTADYEESVATFPASPPAVLLNQLVLNTSTADFGPSNLSAMTIGSVSYTDVSGKDCLAIDSTTGAKITIPCVLSSTSPFTVSYWANVPFTGQWVYPLTLNDGINGIFALGISATQYGTMFSGNFSIGYGSIGFSIPSGFNELAGWNHYTITYEYGNFNLYINGVQKGFYAYANAFTSTQITLGANNQYVQSFTGNGNGLSYISQVCVYNGLPDINNIVNQTLTNTIFNVPSNPLTPYGLSNSVTSSYLDVKWLGATDVTSYTYTLNGIPLTPSVEDVFLKYVRFNDLNPLTTYTVVVTAVGDSDSQSATTIVTTHDIPPTSPVVSIGTVGSYSFTASWTGADRATEYIYKINDAVVLPATENITDKTASFDTPSGTTLGLVVTAVNSGGSANSTPVSVTTLQPPPTEAYGITFSDVTPYSFTMQWEGGYGASSYTYTLNGTPAVPSTDNGLVNNSATFTGLTPNTNYTIVITATNDFGSSPTSIYIECFTADLLMPYGLNATEVGATSFTITWLGGIGATSYSYALGKSTEEPTFIDNGLASKSVTLTGLTPGNVYNVYVSANSETNSAESYIQVWTSEGEIIISPVLILKASNYTSGVWQDESNNSNNATLENGTALKNIAGNGLVLDGSTSWTFPNLALGNAWSVNVWYKNNSNYATVLSQLYNESIVSNLTVVETNGLLQTGFTNNVVSYDNNMITSTNWTNVQATWNGSILRTYINGVLSSTNPSLDNISVDSGMGYRIGSDGYATPGPFMLGEIGEVRIYNAAISEEQVLADYNESLNTFATAVEGEIPTAVTLTLGDLTGTSMSASWTGGLGASSYSYTLNGTPATPSFDKALTERKVAFTGLAPSTSYTLVVTATNVSGSVTATAVDTTLPSPAPVTPALVTALQSSFSSVNSPAAAASAIQAALAQNVAPETLVTAALATASPTMFTALVNSPAFVGRAISIPPTAAATLYAAFSPTVAVNKTLPLNINFPAADGSVKPPTGGANSKLAIDLNRDTYVPFRGATGYGIHVVGGVQYFVTPTNPSGTLVNVGDIIRFTPNGSVELTFTVADLDIVLVPYTPPAVVCFLGSAPVLTPTGYRRIDRIQVGDIVRTPTGTARVEAVKKQAYKPSSYTNPYVIPEGKFGANRKLLISPRHKILVDGKMVEARDLGLEQEEQKQLIYYNLQITKRQNMIVAGVEVESLAALIRVTISNEAFKNILETRYGGKLTDEIKAKCRFLGHGVSVPVMI